MPTTINGDGVVTAGGTASTQGKVVLAEQTGNGTNTVTLQAPASLAADLTLTMPSADGTNGQVLQTNGSGVLSFATATTAPAGSTGQVQINNAGAFGAVSSGTNGQVLTSGGAGNPPTWTTPTPGAMVLLGTTNISGSPTEVIFSGLSGYRVYVLEFTDMAITSSSDNISIGFYTNSVLRNGAGDYTYHQVRQSGTGTTLTGSRTTGSSITLVDVVSSTTYPRCNASGQITIYGGSQSTVGISYTADCVLAYNGGNSPLNQQTRGGFENTELQTLTGVRLFSGTSFSRGTVKIYGIA